MKEIASVKEFQIEILKDLYNAEVLTVSELLYFKKQVQLPGLKEVIQHYLYSCRSRVTAVEELLDEVDNFYYEDHCRTMHSLIRESKKLVEQCSPGMLKDLAIITALQRISTCKKTAYRSLLRIGREASKEQHLILLNGFLKQEEELEETLQHLITDNLNLKEPAI